MRVLITTFAARTHLNLLVPTARALVDAGHSVRVATQPDLLHAVAEAGLDGTGVGRELRLGGIVDGLRSRSVGQSPGSLGAADTDDWHGVRRALFGYGRQVSGVLADDDMLADLVELVGSWRPDVVVWDALTYPGALAASVHGVPHVRSLFGVDRLGDLRRRFHELCPPDADPLRHDPLRPWLESRMRPWGGRFTEDLVTGSHTLDPVPPWLQTPSGGPATAFRWTPYNGGGTVPDWLREPPSRPRVCLTTGVYGRDIGLDSAARPAQLVRSLAELDVEVVATLSDSDRAELGAPPPGVRVVDFVPMDALLPTCSAVVHHLGMGTMLTALQAGVPQIRVDDGTDLWGEQHLAAAMSARGELVDLPGRPSGAVLADAVRSALDDPGRARAAARARDEVARLPGPADVVRVLRAVARGAHDPVPAG